MRNWNQLTDKYTQAHHWYESGLTLSQIGEKMGVTKQSVFKAFKRRGYKLRENGGMSPEIQQRNVEIYQAWKDSGWNLSMQELADKFGLSNSQISRILTKEPKQPAPNRKKIVFSDSEIY